MKLMYLDVDDDDVFFIEFYCCFFSYDIFLVELVMSVFLFLFMGKVFVMVD